MSEKAIRFRCYGCGKAVSSPLPRDAILRAIAWCPECIEARRDQYITPEDARRFRELIEHSSGNEDPDNAALLARLRNFETSR